MALRPAPSRSAKFAFAAALAGLAAAGVKGRLTRFEIADSSMEPALAPGDYLVALAVRTVQRGDIVIYRDPADPSRELAKRAVGLAGETVAVSAGQVAIDGSVLAEPWADGPTLPDGTWTVPAETIFTLGDNRRASSGDGRSSGPVRVSGMYKAVWRYWPPGSFGRL